MNINEMSLDQASDAMLRISNAVSFILADEEVETLLNDISESSSGAWMKWIPKYIPTIARLALQKHRDSLYEIISALSGQKKKDVGHMNFREVVDLLRENWETLMGFFPSTEPLTEKNVITLT